MATIEFINPNPFAVELIGPDKKNIHVPKHTRIVLSDWFVSKYVPKYLRVVRVIDNSDDKSTLHDQRVVGKPHSIVAINQLHNNAIRKPIKRSKIQLKKDRQARHASIPKPNKRHRAGRRIVGKRAHGDPNLIYKTIAANSVYPISNSIGVGILSYNRLGSLQRLIQSIRAHTDLSRTTIFVSDESSSDDVKKWVRNQQDITLIDNQDRLGIAGNSNRLLRCLARFKYKLLLNDDVEILNNGWESFYFDNMTQSGFHHFCFRQPGIYGAKQSEGMTSNRNGVIIQTINDKPQGSVMAFDQTAFTTVGYFDEKFGIYGMEHVDWSHRLSISGIQPLGYHDVHGAERFFTVWHEESAVEDRSTHLATNRNLYSKLSSDNKRVYVNPTNASNIPSVSYIIPYRNASTGRHGSVATIIANIRGQRFPSIEIILVEQDWLQRTDLTMLEPCIYHLVKSDNATRPFNKSMAFNHGVMLSKYDYIILHDADIAVPANYTLDLYKILNDNDSCHLGKQVLYLTEESTSLVNTTKILSSNRSCERAVDYFEGGSVGIKKVAYIKVGGFDEGFEGYGVEDCEFYERIKNHTKFMEDRSTTMIHMWHDRQPGWKMQHQNNKNYLSYMQLKHPADAYHKFLHELFMKRYSH